MILFYSKPTRNPQSKEQGFSAAITAVSARYERTLPSLEADAQRYEDEVNGYLKEMGFIL